MELSEEEVLQILKLIENSDFDFLQLEWGDLKLTVSKGGHDAGTVHQSVRPALTEATPYQRQGAKQGPEGTEVEARGEPAQAKATATEAAVVEALVPIKAPMVGTFYRTPQPGAPPFVEVGDTVQEDTTVGLIEVMKVFNAVKAGVCGVVVEVCVQSGQFVEYGQTLFLVKPEGESAGKKRGDSRDEDLPGAGGQSR